MASSCFDKLWDLHRISRADDSYDLIAIDRVVLHERTGGVALKALAEKRYSVHDPNRVFAIMDHIVSFRDGRGRDEARSPGGDAFITETRAMATKFGIQLIDTDSPYQGIVHVTSPELGIVFPGLSIVCPDSHTCSLGAFGALAWGIGSSEAEHAMATGCLRVKKPPQMRVWVEGELRDGVTAKDLALFLISTHGAAGAGRAAVEFSGPGVAALTIEGRLTLCNMAAEFGAFTALIAPDKKTIDFIGGRMYSPTENEVGGHWGNLRTDPDASFDREITVDATAIEKMISWGTSPEDSIPLSGKVPRDAPETVLHYTGLAKGQAIAGLPIDGAFIGSCTNGRLSDLAAAAEILKGRKVSSGVRAVCVPGSWAVRREAERLGISEVFLQAGFEWGSPGCAMCFYAGGETYGPGARVISSTNRNFEGRQGPGVRTHIADPTVVAASAVAGKISAPANLREREKVR